MGQHTFIRGPSLGWYQYDASIGLSSAVFLPQGLGALDGTYTILQWITCGCARYSWGNSSQWCIQPPHTSSTCKPPSANLLPCPALLQWDRPAALPRFHSPRPRWPPRHPWRMYCCRATCCWTTTEEERSLCRCPWCSSLSTAWTSSARAALCDHYDRVQRYQRTVVQPPTPSTPRATWWTAARTPTNETSTQAASILPTYSTV